MPNAPCPMPHAPCPMPHPHFQSSFTTLYRLIFQPDFLQL
ncbi:hypothetical protein FDUTEX481_03565 [Tolypothrix sp. PCC 7601]|nr:hypothetical protein FDUTEX481_03565 [Tolypothrix sp. PCC 7601]